MVSAGWKPGQRSLGSAGDQGHETSMLMVATSNTSSEPASFQLSVPSPSLGVERQEGWPDSAFLL